MSPSLNDRLIAGIFGMTPEDAAEAAKNKAAYEAAQSLKDKATAVALSERAVTACSFGKAAGAKWLPALVWGAPAAIAILEDGTVLQAEVGLEGYSTLSASDVKNTSVFD